ncbi:MAG TPA: LytTR family DNA-binding domain-containing protein [Chitinophagales bacterium]|nr:LytTR family DNA-binding domain-containing protein [Chitinophagales bacterium]
MIHAIVVDDELKGRQFLKQLVEKFVPQVKMVGEAASAKEALELINATQPDLVFLDIEMPGQSGIEMLRQMQQIDFSVVFVTAFNRYAVEAFRLGAIDYLLKPVSPSDLQQAVERVESNRNIQSQNRVRLNEFSKSYGQPFTKITIPSLQGFEFIDFSDIIYLQSDSNYTRVKLKDGKLIMATRLLGDFEEMLAPHNFFRIHKSYVINLAHMRKYTKGDGGTVMMTDGSEMDVSRRIKESFLQRIRL